MHQGGMLSAELISGVVCGVAGTIAREARCNLARALSAGYGARAEVRAIAMPTGCRKPALLLVPAIVVVAPVAMSTRRML